MARALPAAALVAAAAMATGCDQGPYSNASTDVGPPIRVVDGPVLVNAPSTQIQIAFDRLLMPDSPIRQSFLLTDGSGNVLDPQIAYDPYTRVVTITPPTPVLASGQNYRLTIASPSSPKDLNGLRAIDGAPFDPTQKQPFIVTVPGTIPTGPTLPNVGFCTGDTADPNAKSIQTILLHCGGLDCHNAPAPAAAAGLALDTPGDVQATAMNRIAQGSNTGPWLGQSSPPVVTTFGIDMPIIDQNKANPGNSWLLYKILMAKPDTTNDPDGGAPNNYAVAWQPMTDNERTRLANLIPGPAMPFPPDAPLSDTYYEELSLWIAQGAQVAQCQ